MRDIPPTVLTTKSLQSNKRIQEPPMKIRLPLFCLLGAAACSGLTPAYAQESKSDQPLRAELTPATPSSTLTTPATETPFVCAHHFQHVPIDEALQVLNLTNVLPENVAAVRQVDQNNVVLRAQSPTPQTRFAMEAVLQLFRAIDRPKWTPDQPLQG